MTEAANRTLQRGLSILELLSEHSEGLELHEIASALHLPKSSAHNLLQTLLACRYIAMDGHTRYRLTLRTFEVGAAVVQSTDETQVLRQYMQQIVSECNETVHCGIPAGREVLYIDKVESTQSIRMTSHIGTRMPLHATAMGKSILAAMSDDEVRVLYQGVNLEAFTPHTITDLDALLRQLQQIRENGWALEEEENTENVSCMAVSILDRDGNVRYSLSISCPTFRMTPAARETGVRLLRRAKRRIERVLRAL